MSQFESEYYEEESFWEGNMLQDEANRERIRFTAKLIPQHVTSIADIGCGNGVFVNYLKETAPSLEILAIDRSHTALKYVRTEKKQGDISEIPLADKSVDCASCLEVIEHLPVDIYEKALGELVRISKKYIIISVPYNERLEERYNQCPSCRTIFNYDLHLRNFNDEKIRGLLSNRGFSHVESHHLGLSLNYKGHYAFRKTFYKEQFRQWKSPICPLCGYKEAKENSTQTLHQRVLSTGTNNNKRKLISFLTNLPKIFWPKEKKYYWIVSLYKRTI
jgi:SAM-dependent methyltransferase